MKTTTLPDNYDLNELPEDLCIFDWKADPDEILDVFDHALEAHGLEIEMFETEDDQFLWRIVKR